MENAEEILQCLDEFSKLKPKDIPRELEDYLCFVAKTGDPVYQWPLIKCLFREKLISVITEFYEACPSVEIPPCPNVDTFNYDAMKSFILEKLDTFAAAPFTVQRICELLTSPRKEYNRIDKYMRALEKNILVVSTREPGNRKSTENGESVVNGLESEHVSPDIVNSDINVEVEMDETAVWSKTEPSAPYSSVTETSIVMDSQPASTTTATTVPDAYVVSESKPIEVVVACSSSIETVITSRPVGYIGYTPNITDLIIEPTNTNPPEPVTDTLTVTVSEPQQPQVDNSTVLFSMNTEPIVPTDCTSKQDDEQQTFTEQAAPVYVQATCTESAHAATVTLQPEPHIVQNEATPDTKPEPSVQPTPVANAPDVAASEQPETTAVVSPDTNTSEHTVQQQEEDECLLPSEPEPTTTTTTTQVVEQTSSSVSVVSTEPELTCTEGEEEEGTGDGDTTSEQAPVAVVVVECNTEVAPVVLPPETLTSEAECNTECGAVSQTSGTTTTTTNDDCQTEIETTSGAVEEEVEVTAASAETSDERMEVEESSTEAQIPEPTHNNH